MKIIECPRDAMQGLEEFIPTERKAAYINQLLKVGFDMLIKTLSVRWCINFPLTEYIP